MITEEQLSYYIFRGLQDYCSRTEIEDSLMLACGLRGDGRP